MDRHEFANMVSFTYRCCGRFASIFQVLWSQSDRHERKDMGFIADGGLAVDHDVRIEPDTVAKRDLGPNCRKRANVAAGSEDGPVSDYRGIVNEGRHQCWPDTSVT